MPCFHTSVYVSFQHNLGVRHREKPQVSLLSQQGHRVHDRQGRRLQRLRRHYSILVNLHFNWDSTMISTYCFSCHCNKSSQSITVLQASSCSLVLAF